MKTIRSIKNAIHYFEMCSTYREVRTIKGDKYEAIKPPTNFYSLSLKLKNGITIHYGKYQYFDYVDIITKHREEIDKLTLKITEIGKLK